MVVREEASVAPCLRCFSVSPILAYLLAWLDNKTFFFFFPPLLCLTALGKKVSTVHSLRAALHVVIFFHPKLLILSTCLRGKLCGFFNGREIPLSPVHSSSVPSNVGCYRPRPCEHTEYKPPTKTGSWCISVCATTTILRGAQTCHAPTVQLLQYVPTHTYTVGVRGRNGFLTRTSSFSRHIHTQTHVRVHIHVVCSTVQGGMVGEGGKWPH